MGEITHLPLLRGGQPYRSLATVTLTDVRDGSPVVEVSQANAGLIARDVAAGGAAREALEAIPAAELVAIAGRAAELFARADLPLGDGVQSPDDYLHQLSATTGLPLTLARSNAAKIERALAGMEAVLGGLTRGLALDVLDSGWLDDGERLVAYRRLSDVLGAVLPSNSPGVHTLWLPAVALKTPVVLKPGRQEPWTPHRVAQAFIGAGCPPAAFGLYPTDHGGAAELLLRCGRSMLFGDRSTVAPWRHDPRVELHGPGWSKVLFGPDQADSQLDHLDLLVVSVSSNGGRSCHNASGVWTTAGGRRLAEALAERLAAVEARALDDPEATLAAFPSLEAARRLSAAIDAQLAAGGAEDLTSPLRDGKRFAEVDGCVFMLPTVIWCERPDHPLAQAEYLFPFVSVLEAPADELPGALSETLVLTAVTEDPELRRRLLSAPQVDRLNLGPVPTSRIAHGQPHEGNLFEHLHARRALQLAALGSGGAEATPPA